MAIKKSLEVLQRPDLDAPSLEFAMNLIETTYAELDYRVGEMLQERVQLLELETPQSLALADLIEMVLKNLMEVGGATRSMLKQLT